MLSYLCYIYFLGVEGYLCRLPVVFNLSCFPAGKMMSTLLAYPRSLPFILFGFGLFPFLHSSLLTLSFVFPLRD
ncbi:uncharacterized protein VTP21DRAFT_4264 [Calcarisporiella thermophila]|uniref:uncharacterized protein n=1 Tax=Calcarisporiella thermophila TaxID=911321 RepID=UPI0037423490